MIRKMEPSLQGQAGRFGIVKTVKGKALGTSYCSLPVTKEYTEDEKGVLTRACSDRVIDLN